MPYTKIQNGTRSRIRTVKDTREAWICPNCRRDNKPYNGNCPICYAPRP